MGARHLSRDRTQALHFSRSNMGSAGPVDPRNCHPMCDRFFHGGRKLGDLPLHVSAAIEIKGVLENVHSPCDVEKPRRAI